MLANPYTNAFNIRVLSLLKKALSSFVQDEGGKLETLVPVLTLADFPDASASAQHVKAIMLAYPRTSAIIIREAGILCWGLFTHAQVRAVSDIHASLHRLHTRD